MRMEFDTIAGPGGRCPVMVRCAVLIAVAYAALLGCAPEPKQTSALPPLHLFDAEPVDEADDQAVRVLVDTAGWMMSDGYRMVDSRTFAIGNEYERDRLRAQLESSVFGWDYAYGTIDDETVSGWSRRDQRVALVNATVDGRTVAVVLTSQRSD